MKKTLSILLLSAILTSPPLFLASCSGQNEALESGTTAETGSTSAETEAETDTFVHDSLPADLDLDGKTVTYLYREEIADEFYVGEQSGDVVEDAIYSSFLAVEARLNCDINVVLRAGHYVESRQDYMNHIKKTVMAGDSIYDWADAMIGNFPGLLSEGTFTDISGNKYLDFTKPWWINGIVDANSPSEGIYFVTGDSSLGYFNDAFCLFYNMTLAETLGVDSDKMLSSIDGGVWTYDYLLGIIADVPADLDGNGTYDIDDRLGFVCHNPMHLRGLVLSCGAKFVTQIDGVWQLTFGSERDYNMIEKLNVLLFGTEGSLNLETNEAVDLEKYNEITSKYKAGNILFMTAQLSEVNYLRDMEDDYTVLVLPKYDESQENYITASRNTHNAFGLTATSSDMDAACAVMEALSCQKYNEVVPMYYETALKEKYSRSPEMTKMLDIIHSTMSLSLDYVYNNSFGSPLSEVAINLIKTPDKFYSNLESKRESINKKIENFVLYKEGATY